MVLDTNVIVSRFIIEKGPSARIVDRWVAGAFTLLLSEPILAEYHRVLGYQSVRGRHGLNPEQIDRAVARFRESAVVVEASQPLKVIADDPKDDKFLECAVAGSADYVVSGDAHLLALREYLGIRILSPAAFLAMLD